MRAVILGARSAPTHLPLIARRDPAQQSSHCADGHELTYTYDTKGEHTRITALLDDLQREGIRFKDLRTTQSSLEDIFVDLVRKSR